MILDVGLIGRVGHAAVVRFRYVSVSYFEGPRLGFPIGAALVRPKELGFPVFTTTSFLASPPRNHHGKKPWWFRGGAEY